MILEDLNKQQLQAVTETEGYVRVIAGAGSGKTKALTARFAYIVNELGINASNILCVTFTTKAALEMRNRVKKMIGSDYDLSFITTYHGFCARVLREDIHKLQYPGNFVILDTEDQKAILRDVFDDLKLDSKNFTFKQVLNYIANQKYHLDYISSLLTGKGREGNNDLEKIFSKYIEKQLHNYALDYDDLVNFTLYIYLNHHDILEKWQHRIHYIQVDEMQDSSEEQFRLLKLLAKQNENLFVVGDPDQTIYEWRGARPEILVHFDEEFKNTQTIIMNRNYRSTSKILNLSNNIIRHNKIRVPKEMFTQNEEGSDIIHFHASNEQEESFWIATQIKRLQKEKNAIFSDIAVLYRANYLSRIIEQSLIQANIPYCIYGGIRFFERKEIKDILSYLRLIEGGDNFSFLRAINSPSRGLGKKYIEKIKEIASKQKVSYLEAMESHINQSEIARPGAAEWIQLIQKYRIKKNELRVSDLIKELLDASGLTEILRKDGDAERLENITELIHSVVTMEKADKEPLTLFRYLQEIALYTTDMDVERENDNKVKLMTIHIAKGLEFPHVFLSGMSDGILPNATSIKERGTRAIEEERRLTYVAITRACQSFFMTESEGLNVRNGVNKMPSRFIFEIDEKLYTRKGFMKPEILKEAEDQLNMKINDCFHHQFKVGDQVRHPIWDIGKVIEINEMRGEYQIVFPKIKKIKPITFTFKGLTHV